MYYSKKLADCIVINSILHKTSVEPHRHTSCFFGFDFELAYVKEGSAVHTVEGRRELLCAGDYVLLDFGVQHSYEVKEGESFSLYNLIFDNRAVDLTEGTPSSLAEIAAKRLITVPAAEGKGPGNDYTFRDDDGCVLELLRKIDDEMNKRLPGYYEIAKGALSEILIRALRIYFHKNETPKLSSPIKFICNYVNDYYMLDTTLSEHAEHLGLSLPYLSHRFKEETGVSFLSYLHKRRIDESLRLMANTAEPIEQIAESVGYSDSKKFRERFRELVGMSPREFKKRLNR